MFTYKKYFPIYNMRAAWKSAIDTLVSKSFRLNQNDRIPVSSNRHEHGAVRDILHVNTNYFQTGLWLNKAHACITCSHMLTMLYKRKEFHPSLMWYSKQSTLTIPFFKYHQVSIVYERIFICCFFFLRRYYYQNFPSLGKRFSEPSLPPRKRNQPRVSCDEYESGSCRWYDEWNYDHITEYVRNQQKYIWKIVRYEENVHRTIGVATVYLRHVNT